MLYIDVFEYYESSFGSRFAAVNYIAKCARKLCEEYDDKILDSEAITLVVDESRKHSIEALHKNKQFMNVEEKLIEDKLSFVSNTSVREAAKMSVINSLYKGNLVYQYNDIDDEPTKARVRVLTNMIWDMVLTYRAY